jgi:xanthine dehydrogenase accessory factor
MTKELELWHFIAGRLRRDENVMLLVVAESTGSSPGRQGFKMAVTTDELCGSIGGGIMEVNLVNQARTLLSATAKKILGSKSGDLSIRDPKSEIRNWDGPRVSKGEIGRAASIHQQVHQKSDKNASGMICSGKQTVIFRSLAPEDAGTIGSIIRTLENREPNSLVLTPESVVPEPSIPTAPDFSFESRSETDFTFRERLGHKNDLFIVGGGHCALALSELMSKMDFYIRLFDDRPELNTISKNTFAREKHVIESYEQIAEKVTGGQNIYVVVMTLGFASDEIVIRRLLDKEFRYFGVLGSKAKMAALLKNLKNEGYPEDKLKNIRTPIGLPINSQTPEEIAISIAAEIIAVKNAG